MILQAMTIYGQLEGRKDLSIMQKKVLEPVAEESVIDVNASEVGSDIHSKNWNESENYAHSCLHNINLSLVHQFWIERITHIHSILIFSRKD